MFEFGHDPTRCARAALKDSLSAIFKDPTFRPFIVAEVIEEVHRLKAREETLKASLAGQNETLLEERRPLAKMIDNLVSAIGEVGGSTAMKKKVVAAEARVEQIEALLKHAQEKVSEPIGRDKVSAFVDEEVGRLVDMMFADRETAKNHLRKYIQEIVMMPFDEGGVRGYYVTGSVDLFLGANNVMQEDPLETIPLHYTFGFQILVAGARRAAKKVKDCWVDPIVEHSVAHASSLLSDTPMVSLTS
jgi:hypothetical protein